MQLIEKRVDDERMLELLRTIILSHGDETGKGIPLGNVTSQLFANIYLHELDWFMKQTFGIKHYLGISIHANAYRLSQVVQLRA